MFCPTSSVNNIDPVGPLLVCAARNPESCDIQSDLVENTLEYHASGGMFSGRGYNIDSLNGPTHDPEKSHDRQHAGTTPHWNRSFSDCTIGQHVGITDFREHEYIDRELVMVRVKATAKNRSEVMQITDIFRAKIVDVQSKTMTIEVTGNESKVNRIVALMDNFGVDSRLRARALPRS